ncbi:hypothetical protein BV511_15075 [Methylorubrum extorquens]|uniref:hypothetical protein n=1 Tax=Methylorubrum extorquens TaxID=408 RepID=UPI000972AAC4|nr:hypothetical protein [Methylorubrum extorquens]APX85910.1 hypothetical protein BV511_15075 [Methylorubrum extorquens]
MTLNFATLRKAVKRLKAVQDQRPDGRRTTGATALIRAALPEIRRLRDVDGQPWAVIAAALGEQGVRQGREGKPITADRLIALVLQIEAQIARADAGIVGRGTRIDLAGSPSGEIRPTPPSDPAPGPAPGRLRLSPDLQARPTPLHDDHPLSEAEIRQLQVDKHSHLFKKD